MKKALSVLLAISASVAALLAATTSTRAQNQDWQYFPQTGHTVSGTFLTYWQQHGGLAQQGYPISELFVEKSDLDGKSYQVQYFERAVFEMHPENKPPYNVLLSQLGTFQYKAKYPDGAPGQQAHAGGQLFKETGFAVGGDFLTYWNKNGGLAQQGYPISNEFSETSPLDGKQYTVQYFERAVFEMHPENQPPYNVLLSQLGTFQLKQKYPDGAPGGQATPPATSQPVPTNTPGSANPPQATPTPQTQTPPQATPTGKAGTNCQPVDSGRKSTISSTGPVAIGDVQYSGQEYVHIVNKGQSAANISGWKLSDKNDSGQSYTFPAGTQIPASGSVDVYTEPGHPYSFNSKSAIWNNCGDALELRDSSGAVVATYAYGTHLAP